MLNVSGLNFTFKAVRQTDVGWMPYQLIFALAVLPGKSG